MSAAKETLIHTYEKDHQFRTPQQKRQRIKAVVSHGAFSIDVFFTNKITGR